jgi:CRISP-associated protein Cas1
MNERLIDLAEEPVRLSVRGELLVISRATDEDPEADEEENTPEGEEVSRRGVRGAHYFASNPTETTVPLEEIGVLVASHPRVTFTQAVLAALAGTGGVFIACDGKHVPAAMMLPLDAHFVQGERFVRQAEAGLPLRKRLWQQVVRSKMLSQSRHLIELQGDDAGITALAERVRSGDPDNLEAQASRCYWAVLFPDSGFTREREGPGPNAALNYGYAVLRAVVSRAVCASGLHPSLGLHHHNRYDSFRLSSDLMEPFRHIVDRAVVSLVRERGFDCPIDRTTKTALLGALAAKVSIEGEFRTLFDASARMAQSLVAVFEGGRKDLVLPDD